jgi:hypothetical protein
LADAVVESKQGEQFEPEPVPVPAPVEAEHEAEAEEEAASGLEAEGYAPEEFRAEEEF